MPARRHSLCLLILLLIAGPALLPSSAHGAIRRCDVRVLPRADTLSVEAAARKAADGKLPDIHVQGSCITNATTSVNLIRPNPTDSSSRREQWEMSCDREQSTWYKRGGWKCDAPHIARNMDATISFLGTQRALSIRSDADVSFETAEALARRALAVVERATPAPDHCSEGVPLHSSNDVEWKRIREEHLADVDPSTLDVYISADDGVLRIQPLDPFSSLSLNFGPAAAAADPTHVPLCWAEILYFD